MLQKPHKTNTMGIHMTRVDELMSSEASIIKKKKKKSLRLLIKIIALFT